MLDSQLENWHGIFVVTGDEERVKERIKYRLSADYNVIVPKRKLKVRKGGTWKVDTRVLFPGYVLLNGDVNCDIYYQMKNIPNMLRLLRTGSVMSAIDSKEMSVLSKLICNNEEIGISNILYENDRVRVVDGPLFSLEGLILSIDHRKGRARVRLSFMGEDRTVDLGVSVLSPA